MTNRKRNDYKTITNYVKHCIQRFHYGTVNKSNFQKIEYRMGRDLLEKDFDRSERIIFSIWLNRNVYGC